MQLCSITSSSFVIFTQAYLSSGQNKMDTVPLYINTQLQKIIWRRTPFGYFFFFWHWGKSSLACPFPQLVKTQSQEHTHTKKTDPAPQAMMDSIKSNSATVAHFKVNLSQHFDILKKNKACQVYFRSSFELLSQFKKNRGEVSYLTIRFQIREL